MLKIRSNFINNKKLLIGKWFFTKLFTKCLNPFFIYKKDFYICIIKKKVYSILLGDKKTKNQKKKIFDSTKEDFQFVKKKRKRKKGTSILYIYIYTHTFF